MDIEMAALHRPVADDRLLDAAPAAGGITAGIAMSPPIESASARGPGPGDDDDDDDDDQPGRGGDVGNIDPDDDDEGYDDEEEDDDEDPLQVRARD
jgi:hypothetical protein